MPAPTNTNPSIGRSAVRGVMYATFATGIGKSASFVAQLILGWVLSDGDFAVYAVAVGVFTFGNALQHGGAQLLMLQGASDIDRVLPAAMRLAVIFDLTIPAIVAVIALPMERAFNMPGLAQLLWVICFAFPLTLFGLPYRAKAAAEGRFGDVSFADGVQTISQNGFIVLFAFLGLGPLSFVLGQPLVNLLDWFLLRRRGKLRVDRAHSVSLRSLLRPAAFVLIAALGVALAVGSVENLVLGQLATVAILANYFFGFRLTSAVSLIFGSGIRSVLLPSFARLNHDRDRQEVAALSSIRIFLFIAIPTCGLAAVVAPGLVHVLWQGKWDGAGIVVLALLLSLPFGLALYIARSLLEARGGWGRAAAMSWSNGVLITLVTIWVGASNDLPWIAGVIASYRALSGLLFITVILMMCRISPLRLAPMIMPVICIGAGSILVSQWCSGGFFPEEQTLRHSIMAAGGFIGSFVVLSAVFVRTGYMEVISRLGRFRS